MENHNYQTPPYSQDNVSNVAYLETAPVMTVKQWLLTILLMIIPIVNIVFLFIWAFGDKSVNPNKSSWAKATLIILAIGIVLQIIIFAAFGSMFMSMADLAGGGGAYL